MASKESELEQIETIVREAADPVVTVPEVAEKIGRSKPHVRELLRVLEHQGAVDSKHVGAHATAWWHTDRVIGPDHDPATTSAALEHLREDGPAAPPAPAQDRPVDDADDDQDQMDVDAAADVVEIAGRGEVVNVRREALRAALERLRTVGPAKVSRITEPTYDSYDVGYESEESWRIHVVSPALRELRDEWDVVELDRGAPSEWKWTGA